MRPRCQIPDRCITRILFCALRAPGNPTTISVVRPGPAKYLVTLRPYAEVSLALPALGLLTS